LHQMSICLKQYSILELILNNGQNYERSVDNKF
jgi:hypothetical protein